LDGCGLFTICGVPFNEYSSCNVDNGLAPGITGGVCPSNWLKVEPLFVSKFNSPIVFYFIINIF
jgi:hypothetical protein